MINKRIIILAAISVTIMILLFVVFSIINRSTVTVVVDYENFSPISTSVTIDEESLAPQGGDVNVYTKRTNTGKHKVIVSGPTIESREFEVSTSFFENKEIAADGFNVLSAEEIAKGTYGVDSMSEIKVFNSKLFADNTWLAFSVGDGVGNGAIIVSRYELSEKVWVIVGEGTDLDFTSDELSEAPKDLRNYIYDL